MLGSRGSGGGPPQLELDLTATHAWHGAACGELLDCMQELNNDNGQDLTAGCDLSSIKEGLQANPR